MKMSNCKTLGVWLRRYLEDYVVFDRNLAENTRKSYRDTFALMLPFISKGARKPVDRLIIDDLTVDRLRAFLDHVETERGCSVVTRNRRLFAVCAFARFVASRDPALVAWYGHIRTLPVKRTAPKTVAWLTRAETNALLAIPDRTTPRGRTEHAILIFLVNTGARVSEATGLRVGDIAFGQGAGNFALVTLHGKGGKVRQCPLWKDTEQVLAEQVAGRSNDEPVFTSRYGRAYTRFGLYRLIERCAATVPELSGRAITPHVLRHTAACSLVRAGADLDTIRAWLGHVSIDTTNIYAEIDLGMKARAMSICDAVEGGPTRPWKKDRGVMAFLRSL